MERTIFEPRIGLALGGGGAKGAAHVGILKVFEKYGIKISAIVGTSAGSVIGAGYALGFSPDEITKKTEKFNNRKFLKFSNFHLFRESLIKAKDIEAAIKEVVEDKTFEDIKIPLLILATDLESGNAVKLNSGKLWEAVRASSALPGIFSPYFIEGQYLVDGGLLNDIPVTPLRENKDIDIVIGVELGSLTSRQYISGMIWEKYYQKPKTFKLYPGMFTRMKLNFAQMLHIMLRSIDIIREEEQQIKYLAAKPDLIIRPDVESISLLEFNKYKQGIQSGIDAAERVMPELFDLIEKAKDRLNS